MMLQNLTGETLRRGVFWGCQALVVLIPLVFSSMFREYATPKEVLIQVIAIAMGMCWVASMILDGEVAFIETPLHYTFMGFLVVQFVSLFLAYNVFDGIDTLFGYMSFFLIASAVFHTLQNLEDMKRICLLMVGTASIVALIGLLQHNGVYHFGAPWNLPISTIGNVNFTAQYYNVVFPIALVMLFLVRHFWLQVGIGSAVFLMACHLIVLGSRGGWLGASVALLTLGVTSLFRHYRVGRRLADLLVLGVVLIGLGWPVITGMMSGIQVGDGRNLGQVVGDYQSRMTQRVENAVYLADDSTLQRLYLWQDTVRMIWDKPLLGVGMGNFAFNVPKYMSHESLVVKQRREAQTGQELMAFSAHNEYLEVWAETGFLGVVVLGVLLYQLLTEVYRLIVRYVRGEASLLVVGFVAAVLATLAHAFFSTNLQQPVSATHFWIVVGMIWSLKLNVEGRQFVGILETRGPRFARALLMLSAAVLLVVVVMGGRTLLGEYYFQRGNIYFQRQNYAEAERAWARAAELEPNKYFQTLQSLGTVRYNLKNWEGAAFALKESLRYFPNNAQVHYLLGRSYMELEAAKDGLPHLQSATDLNPLVAAYQVGLGEALLQTGNVSDAVATLEGALALNANLAEAHQLLGASFKQMGNLDQAVGAYRKALAIEPKNKEVLNSLAVVYSTQGDFASAEDILKRLIQEAPQNLDYRFNLSVVQFQLENYGDAEKTLLDILNVAPQYIRAYVVLGQVYETVGRVADAQRIYQMALQRWPNEATFHNALQQFNAN